MRYVKKRINKKKINHFFFLKLKIADWYWEVNTFLFLPSFFFFFFFPFLSEKHLLFFHSFLFLSSSSTNCFSLVFSQDFFYRFAIKEELRQEERKKYWKIKKKKVIWRIWFEESDCLAIKFMGYIWLFFLFNC